MIKQLQKQVEKLDFKKLPVQDKIQGEIKRFKKFQMMATGKNQNIDVSDVDVKNYIKFLLKEGDDQEKRALLTCLNGETLLKNKIIYIK